MVTTKWQWRILWLGLGVAGAAWNGANAQVPTPTAPSLVLPRPRPAWARPGNLFTNGDFAHALEMGWEESVNLRPRTIFGQDTSDTFIGQNWALVDTVEQVLRMSHYGASSIQIKQVVRVYTHELVLRLTAKFRVAGMPSTNATARVIIAYLGRGRSLLGKNVILYTSGWSEAVTEAEEAEGFESVAEVIDVREGLHGIRLDELVDTLAGFEPDESATVRYLERSAAGRSSDVETGWRDFRIDLEEEFMRHLVGINPRKLRYVGIFFWCGGWVGVGEEPLGIAQMEVKKVSLEYKPKVYAGK